MQHHAPDSNAFMYALSALVRADCRTTGLLIGVVVGALVELWVILLLRLVSGGSFTGAETLALATVLCSPSVTATLLRI